MRKIFIDANVLIGVLNKEYPLFRPASRVLSLADHPKFQLFTSPTCLAIAFYFAQKKSGAVAAKQKIGVLLSRLSIAPTGHLETLSAIENKAVLDFEDGLQYYSALHAGCHAIVTEDRHDFHFSSLPVVDCETYLKEFALDIVKKA